MGLGKKHQDGIQKLVELTQGGDGATRVHFTIRAGTSSADRHHLEPLPQRHPSICHLAPLAPCVRFRS